MSGHQAVGPVPADESSRTASVRGDLGYTGGRARPPVGRCRVAISLTGPSPPLPEHLAKAEAAAETLRMPGKPLIPKKYFSPETSRLTADVVAKTDNVFDFPLDGDLTP
ncbi:hypothetical protein [Gemmata sp. SH-PL17]|uniref:hypothetical protein n=1 Tax=Gemmata sp. SH-PL17 TaxID=1630693 RepID=UPI00138FD02A|nr:hypothetical protein [Gemmata sp. SH-PL17]